MSIAANILSGHSRILAAEAPRVWLLGVTPEIAALPCLQHAQLIATERIRKMIDCVWPGDTTQRHAICGDWSRPPFPDRTFDLAIGDGCLSVVGYPLELSRVLAAVNRCLNDDGYLLLRLFCRPDPSEPPDDVVAALRAGNIGNFHAFKWRLAMAVQGTNNGPDVAVRSVWEIWRDARIDPRALATRLNWPLAQIETMEIYRDSPARYNFMPLARAIEHLHRGGFSLVASRTGNYELAHCCPHVLLRKDRHAIV